MQRHAPVKQKKKKTELVNPISKLHLSNKKKTTASGIPSFTVKYFNMFLFLSHCVLSHIYSVMQCSTCIVSFGKFSACNRPVSYRTAVIKHFGCFPFIEVLLLQPPIHPRNSLTTLTVTLIGWQQRRWCNSQEHPDSSGWHTVDLTYLLKWSLFYHPKWSI